jgi:hypothetical protein
MKRFAVAGFVAALISGLMLTKSDAAALQSSKLGPSGNNAVGSIAMARPVVLGKITYATYIASLPTDPVLMTAYFDGGVLRPGDQFVAVVTGTASNNTGANRSIYCYAQVTQGGVSQTIGSGIATAIDTTGTFVAWRCDISLGANVPGAVGQYTRPTQPQPGTQSGLPAPLVSTAIGFAGSGQTLITDTALTGAVYAGGFIRAGAATSAMQATKSQITYASTAPLRIDILLGGVSAGGVNWNVTVESGYFLGL